MIRIAIATLLVLLVAAPALAAWPVFINFSRICDETGNLLRVTIENYGYDDPPPDFLCTVIRRTTAPGLADPWLVTETPLTLPPYGEHAIYNFPENDLPADAIGYYEGWIDDQGYEYLEAEGDLSCVDHPYLLRGLLVDEDTVDPCADIGLLECTAVLISDVEFLQHVGTGEMLDIYGWPLVLNGVSSCTIAITDIEPLGEGATCSEPVATESHSWTAVKAMFD